MAIDTFVPVLRRAGNRLAVIPRARRGRRAAWLTMATVALAGCGVAAAADSMGGGPLTPAGPVAAAVRAPAVVTAPPVLPRPVPAAPVPAPPPPAPGLGGLLSRLLYAPPPPHPPPPPRHYQPGRPVRIMFIGDSVAQTTAAGLGPLASQYGGAIANEGIMGCGVVTASPYVYFGQQANLLPQCRTWAATWQAAVVRDSPDVVAILVGRWELMDRFYQGRWTHLGDPAFDAYVESQLEHGIAIATSRGAKVALLTVPYYLRGHTPAGGLFPEDDPARVDHENALFRRVAARYPGLVSVINFGAFLSPGGHFSMVVDGVQVRSDGVHITPQTGPWLAPRIMPQLVDIGRTA
ncbi:MAG TPA: SGNH hydrolase domain-containing protein [Acidimicrobiales bacterium]|nr:SGNH hydrolase domain-containing protein [Acidimicrobiales bacterium]